MSKEKIRADYTLDPKKNKAEVEMTVSPYMEQLFKEGFNVEIEMMQGTRKELPNGQIHIKLELEGEKMEMFHKFMLTFFVKEEQPN